MQLDDQFFTSDPFADIRLRILRLLNEDPPVCAGLQAEEFTRLLGPSSVTYQEHDQRTSTLQVAVDAFALRHQVAESLLRFLHVVLHHEPGKSHWVELVDTPISMLDVLSENRAVLDGRPDKGTQLLVEVLAPTRSVGSEQTATRRLPTKAKPGVTFEATAPADEVDRALDIFVQWMNLAITLFAQRDPDLNAAHNKFKHGMGLRPQDDVLSVLMGTPPNDDGTVPLSSITGDRAINLFDGVTTEFLARVSRKEGLEVTQIAMEPVPTLVEAGAMAHMLALLFHNAALKHFADHPPRDGRFAPGHPGLLLDGPVPGRLRSPRPFALRFPLTTPVRPGAGSEAWVFWTNGEIQTLAFGEPIKGVVVDDTFDGDGPVGREP